MVLKKFEVLTLFMKNSSDIDTANMNKLQKIEEVLVDQMLQTAKDFIFLTDLLF